MVSLIRVLVNIAVSTSWGSFLMGVLVTRALPFGVHIGAPGFWKLPYFFV